MLCGREGLILSSILAEFLIMFALSLTSAKFTTGVFSLFVGVLSDITEDFELNISNTGKEISADKNVLFKKMNNKHKFLPIIKSLIAPSKNVVSMITQVYAKSKL